MQSVVETGEKKPLIGWKDKFCLYSNGNFVGEFDSMPDVEGFIQRAVMYFENAAEEISARKYTVVPSRYAVVGK